MTTLRSSKISSLISFMMKTMRGGFLVFMELMAVKGGLRRPLLVTMVTRAGYLIACYLMDVLDYTAMEAIAAFNTAAGPGAGITRPHYLARLRARN